MKNDELVCSLRQIQTLVAECLKIAGQRPDQKVASARTLKATPTSLPQRIELLRDSGFFAQPRTVREVHAKISTTYPCEQERVKTALRRVAKNRQLRKVTKTADEKKHAAYAW